MDNFQNVQLVEDVQLINNYFLEQEVGYYFPKLYYAWKRLSGFFEKKIEGENHESSHRICEQFIHQ